MLPLRLELRNFMCYRGPVGPVDFSGMRVACLAGPNGAGKSALLDAITWALWGQARIGSDDLVHSGESDMAVSLEFLVAEERYRVIRQVTRGRTRRRGQTLLELQVHDGEGFRPVTGNTLRQTQQRIQDLLRLSYDTFVNSAFLRQGRADEFTTKPPAQRKAVLGEILDLSVYDELAEKARRRARESGDRRQAIEGVIAEVERDLDTREAAEAQHEESLRRLKVAEERLDAAETSLNGLRARQQALESQKEQLAQQRTALERERQELSLLRQDLAKHRRALRELDELQDQREQIEAGFLRLRQAREELLRLEEAGSRLLQLTRLREPLQAAIASARTRLEADLAAAEAEMESLRHRASRREEYEARLADCRRRLAAVEKAQESSAARRRELEALLQESTAQEAAAQALSSELEALRGKLALLSQAGARCPVCGQELGEADREHLRSEFEQQVGEREDALREARSAVQEAGQRRAALADELSRTEMHLREQGSRLAAAVSEAEAGLREAEGAETRLSEEQRRIGQLRSAVLEGRYAEKERVELSRIEEQIRQVPYEADRLAELRAEVARLAGFEERHRSLAGADARAEAEMQLVENGERAEEQAESRVTRLEDSCRFLERQIQGAEELAQQLQEAEGRYAQAQEEERRARRAVGAAEERLERLRETEAQLRQRRAQLRAAADEEALYDELALAFGKQGVQALLIEAVLPELEEEAGALLARMTDNRMRIKLESQRQTQSGRTVETLEVYVGDELGDRPYESFSGGEAFRIDFALRVALSKLLARRAGARLPTLVIDEGFGSQDSHGRDRLVEAIQAIREDFERIFVVTHIDEIKDAFDSRIEVSRGPEGAVVTVV